ncbi:GNAT family N-acetyltransferase [Scopulibacillus cellulosilyticus]|uniref:GNAT family N-acetyltransferase n=1 Tax=Scopulibacillus cellulosilyticus TaxID=2665665 RepID=A0ABW2PVF4_9BACL
MLIASERLLFRSYNDDDFDFLMSLLSDPEMVRFIGNGKTRDKNGGEKFLDWIYSTYKFGKDMGLMVLTRIEDDTPIGHAGLVPQTINDKEEIEIGYWISRKYWGKGYATEAARSLKDYGTKSLDIKRFIALIQPENLASRKVANKIGMHLEKKIVLDSQDVNVYSVSCG